jgi:hypothetical protein
MMLRVSKKHLGSCQATFIYRYGEKNHFGAMPLSLWCLLPLVMPLP